MFGCGAVAQVILSEGSHGRFLTINLAFAFAATLGILVCGQVSGRQTPLKLHLKLLLCMALETGLSFYKRFFVDEPFGREDFFSPPLGGHLNPAVTFALCLLGREKWRKFPVYFLFQTIGSFLGAAIIFAEYHDAMYDYAGESNELLVTGEKATAGIFATYPSPHLTILNGFFDQVSNCKFTSL
ncbi:aquaporin-9 [Pimephales promelas]|nr:aquaporin-9 [Pimephales promelas]KAG1937274.1 aquaporin-9 [Pimephales promelas]